MIRWIATSLAVLAMAAAILAIRQTIELRRAAALLASAERDAQALNAQLRAAQAAPPTIPAATPAAAASSAEAVRAARQARREQLVNADPAVQAAVGKLVEFENSQYLDPLLRSAGLSQAGLQRAEFLADQLLSFDTPYSGTLSPKTDPRTDDEIRAELAQLLGPQGTDRLAAYQIDRSLTSGLTGNLSAAGSPLSGEQLAKLTQILVENNQRPSAPGGWDDPARTDWPMAMAQAGAVLSPAQLTVLKDFAVSRFGAELR